MPSTNAAVAIGNSEQIVGDSSGADASGYRLDSDTVIHRLEVDTRRTPPRKGSRESPTSPGRCASVDLSGRACATENPSTGTAEGFLHLLPRPQSAAILEPSCQTTDRAYTQAFSRSPKLDTLFAGPYPPSVVLAVAKRTVAGAVDIGDWHRQILGWVSNVGRAAYRWHP